MTLRIIPACLALALAGCSSGDPSCLKLLAFDQTQKHVSSICGEPTKRRVVAGRGQIIEYWIYDVGLEVRFDGGYVVSWSYL